MQKGFSLLILITVFGVIAAISGAAYFYLESQKKPKVSSFEECARYYPVMESYPEQCNTPDGKHFVQLILESNKNVSEDVGSNNKINSFPGWKKYISSTTSAQFSYPTEFTYVESNNRSGSATTFQDIVRFENGEKVFVFDHLLLEGGIPPYMKTDKEQVFNGLTWMVLDQSPESEYCDAGQCAGLASGYYLFKDGYQYSFFYYSSDLKPVIEDILKTFKFL